MTDLLLTVESTGRAVRLDQECTLGRAAGNTLDFPDDETMSREHARIRRRDDERILSDLGTRNGSFLERGGARSRVTESVLQPGDVIVVGAQRLLVSIAPEEAGTETVIQDPDLTNVSDATQVGGILPDVGGLDAPAQEPSAPRGRKRRWWRRLL